MSSTEDIRFVSIKQLLEDYQIPMPRFNCLCSDPAHFKLLQVQLQAHFLYDAENGPTVKDKHHVLAKCRQSLRLAKAEQTDLVLFPEYCVPYELLLQIAENQEEWPFHQRLWCLPCEAIRQSDFGKFLKKLSAITNVVVSDQYCAGQHVNQRSFVNALFYCFTAFQDNVEKLVLIPQMKMHAMRDFTYICEADGLSTGKTLLYFRQNQMCLLSLICADVFKNGVAWENICEQVDCRNLIVLHPQLNTNPREMSFRHLRHEMMTQNNASLYLTCNYAAGTTLSPSESADDGREQLKIDLSWSCIYQKHNTNVAWEQVKGTRESRRKNLTNGICTGMISKCRTMIWFKDSSECLNICRVALPNPTNYAIANQYQPFKAMKLYAWSDEAENWEESSYAYSLQEKLQSEKRLLETNQLFSGRWSIFPLNANTENKDEADCFFALAACRQSDVLEFDDNSETPAAWTLLLDENDMIHADKELNILLRLMRNMDAPPRHLHPFKGHWHFVGLFGSNGQPLANIQHDQETSRRLIVAYADTRREAQCYLSYLKKKVLSEEDGRENRKVCIFYHDPETDRTNFLPRVQTDITIGDEFETCTSIIDGGTD